MTSSSIRDQIRAKIFTTHELAIRRVEFFGSDIELRQPTLNDVMTIQEAARTTEDGEIPKSSIVAVLLQYAFVPGTNEKVFEEGDADAIMDLPFGADMTRITSALSELTDVNFTPKIDTSGKTPDAT